MFTVTGKGVSEYNITANEADGVGVYTVSLKCDGIRSVTIEWREHATNCDAVWTPRYLGSTALRPDYVAAEVLSCLSENAPVIAAVAADDTCPVTVALSDAAMPIKLSCGISETERDLHVKAELFAATGVAVPEYRVEIRVDRRGLSFARAIESVKEYWRQKGYAAGECNYAATEPVYSTWYNFHQNLAQAELVRECEQAVELGLKTIIIDDGWQTDDNALGYAYCGDWQVCEKKFPDFKRFVQDVHAAGMRVMVWFSLPFAGEKSRNFERFQGKYLCHNSHNQASVLDPRYPEVREFLVDTYVNFIQRYEIDGFKFDFIDEFRFADEVIPFGVGMDCACVEDGVAKLVSQAAQRIRAVNPAALIEFRQKYIGPIVTANADMVRVADCPLDWRTNAREIINLRLLTPVAVHADMVVLHEEESASAAARHILATLLGVPQISVKLCSCKPEHKKMLAYLLQFARAHRELLLHGTLTVHGVAFGYTSAESVLADERAVFLYGEIAVAIGAEKITYILNVSARRDLYVEVDSPAAHCVVYACTGEEVSRRELQKGICKLSIPESAIIVISRQCMI